MRTLMLIPYPHIQGPLPKIVPLLIASLRKLGCQIETEYWSRHSDAETLPAKLLGRIGDLHRIRRHLRSHHIDLMYVTTAHNWAGLLRDVPLILLTQRHCRHRLVHFHGSSSDRLGTPGDRLFKLASRLVVSKCDAILVLSQQERDEWSRFFPAGRFEVVRNPFLSDKTRITEAQRARTASETTHPGELLYVGRLMKEKGVLDLIVALKEVNADTPCRLQVAGDGPLAEDARRLATQLGVADKVSFLGYVGGAELDALYRSVDVFVLPTYYAEGFPTVILEAMGAGLPVITTRLRGAADVLEDGVNGLFVPAQDPRALAQAVRSLLKDDSLRASMSRANMIKVTEFEPDAVAPRYMSIMKEIVGPLQTAGGSPTD